MAQVTEGQLFEMLGRLFAELRAVNAENTQLRAVVAQAKQPEQSAGRTPQTEDSGAPDPPLPEPEE